MSKEGLLKRLLIKACPQFLEDWAGNAGRSFRNGIDRLTDYNRRHVKAGDKLDETPDLIWKAAQGAANSQIAKAEADYAKAETDRMEAELRRRTMEARTRHECADANKAEAEAGIARIKEIQARLELFQQLNVAGVTVSMDSSLNISIGVAPPRPELQPEDVWTLDELASIRSSLTNVRCPNQEGQVTLYRWHTTIGARLKPGDPICDLMRHDSPQTSVTITAPHPGMVIRLSSHMENMVIQLNSVLAVLLRDPETTKTT